MKLVTGILSLHTETRGNVSAIVLLPVGFQKVFSFSLFYNTEGSLMVPWQRQDTYTRVARKKPDSNGKI